MSDVFSRALWLAAQHDLFLPPQMVKLLPNGEMIRAVLAGGLGGASAELSIPLAQLNHLAEIGSDIGGTGSVEELRSLITNAALKELQLRQEDYRLTEYLRLLKVVSDFGLAKSDSIIQADETTLDLEVEGSDVPKFNCGFTPIDVVTGGLYQGVMTIMGKPGSGKTSIMLAMMVEAKRTGLARSQWFFETEIPMPLMLYKLDHAKKHGVAFTENDRMICGFVTMPEILQRVEEDPDPERIIYIDGPDVMSGGAGDGKRFAIESIYRDLIRLKSLCRLVVVSSQMKRSDVEAGLTSAVESSAKEWYTDMLVGIRRTTPAPGGASNMILNTPKNRFGIPDMKITAVFNYTTLEGHAEALSDAEEDW